ncbi:sensor histidine kinase [Spirochaetia bacterium]|nr:sensor histidine kinase [Spirochaetia bacterium]
MTISLQKIIALIITFFVCAVIFILSVVIGISARKIFAEYVKQNIEKQTAEIIRSISEQYVSSSDDFNMQGIDAIGMHYMHQGFFVSVKNNDDKMLWNIREMNSTDCALIVEEIQTRMKKELKTVGDFQKIAYPIQHNNENIASIVIESYGPFFYSEGEVRFIKTLNRIFAASGVLFALLSIMLSFFISNFLSKPVLDTADAAERIAQGDFSIRVPQKKRIKELARLSLSINDLALTLENGEQWQKRLSSDIAHELRTPLTALQGNIEGMLDGVFEASEKRLTVCKDEIERLTNLVSDLNQLSLLEKENLILKKTDFDLAELLQAVTEEFTLLASEKGLHITTRTESAPLHADYEKLKQVFINLFSNAIKYTDNGDITVTLKAEKNNYHYKISVRDTGIGIPEADLPHIFERFYRTDKSRNRGTGGTGIGLTVVLSIVKAHGGTVCVENQKERGTVFTVFL